MKTDSSRNHNNAFGRCEIWKEGHIRPGPWSSPVGADGTLGEKWHTRDLMHVFFVKQLAILYNGNTLYESGWVELAHPKKFAHGWRFVVICCLFGTGRVKLYDFPHVSEATLMNVGKIIIGFTSVSSKECTQSKRKHRTYLMTYTCNLYWKVGRST